MLLLGTGRGDKVHMIRATTIDNVRKVSTCGANIDTVIEERFAEKDKFCGNCRRTNEYHEVMTDK